jgi:hypothetical protein
LVIAFLTGMKLNLNVVLVGISPVGKDVECVFHLCICHL